MQVYAHRGASIERPENTMAAFDLALEHGAEGVELDIVRSKDDQLAVIHDLTLDRTTNGTGPVRELTATELGRLDAGQREGVPTLDDVLALVAGRARVNIELKEADLVDEVIEVVGRHPDLDWFASGAHWDALQQLRERSGAAVYPLTIGPEDNLPAMIDLGRRAQPDFDVAAAITKLGPVATGLDVALDFAERIGAEGLSIWHYGITAETISAIHDRDLRAWVWTVNDPDQAAELIELGADAICTDDPAAVLEVRSRSGRPTAAVARG